jgi:SAM-dependent methyltransferase
VFASPANCALPDLSLAPEQLPRLGVVSRGESDYLARFQECVTGRNVLCIGYSQTQLDDWVAKFSPRSISCLTLWADHADGAVSKHPLVIGDITKRTDFPDDAFDAVISLATLEHLVDLEAGLLEMKRLTRSGGDVLAQFGPAWSCPYGHHIYHKQGDALLDFSAWKMPAFLHLLCRPEDIARFYAQSGYPEGGHAAMHWFYEAPHINRIMYDDYVRLFFKHFQVQVAEHMCSDVPATILELLRRKYAPYQDFSTYGGKYWFKVLK